MNDLFLTDPIDHRFILKFGNTYLGVLIEGFNLTFMFGPTYTLNKKKCQINQLVQDKIPKKKQRKQEQRKLDFESEVAKHKTKQHKIEHQNKELRAKIDEERVSVMVIGERFPRMYPVNIGAFVETAAILPCLLHKTCIKQKDIENGPFGFKKLKNTALSPCEHRVVKIPFKTAQLVARR